jgi:hypothetical protein
MVLPATEIKIFILEYKSNTNFFSRITKLFTKTSYYHSGLIVDICHCDLSIKDGPDFLIKRYFNIDKVYDKLKKECKQDRCQIDVIELPYYFNEQNFNRVLNWWETKSKDKYSLFKLIDMSRTSLLLPLYKWYYRLRKKPYKLKWDAKGYVCSGAVDASILAGTGIDLIPEITDRVVYPGLFAMRYKKHIIKTIK